MIYKDKSKHSYVLMQQNMSEDQSVLEANQDAQRKL